jgi:formate dehydrogenase
MERSTKRRGTLKGRQVDAGALARVRRLLGDAPRQRDLLIEYLHLIQDAFGHLSAAHLAALASEMGLPMAEVFEVATFYHHFDVVKEGSKAPPSLTVRVCDSLSCEMAGAGALLSKLRDTLGHEVRVISAPCVGRCAAAPVAVVQRNPIEQATAETVTKAVQSDQTECAVRQYIGFEQYRKEGGYRLLSRCLKGRRQREEVFTTMEQSGLRGLGGAGFPAGRKWRIVWGEAAPRLMAINIDEGEPGTFKDRYFLEHDPHRFLEGAMVAAWAAGCAEIYIYLRDEYAGCRTILHNELAALERNPPCAIPPIRLRRGAGAYICGEESAMIESIEGKRGMPRLRPPYVAQVGLFGRPTLEHNMETCYWVRDIIEKGPHWFSGQGRRGRKGLRSFSVSGRINRQAQYVRPAGITLNELIDEYCDGMLAGHSLYGYLPGGASGGILPASLADVPLDFDTLPPYGCFIGSAAVIVLSDQDRARAAALNIMRFFHHESCGQCTPCRVGTAKALNLMESEPWDTALLKELSHVMADASICGLGQAAPNPLLSVINHFSDELK